MAAYAALVSLMHIIDRIQLHPRPPISLDKSQVESLTEKVNFLEDFLQDYSYVDSKEGDGLESQIANAAYAAEDILESHIVDSILVARSINYGEKRSSVDLYEGLQKVIEDMDFIKKEAMQIKGKMGVQHQLQRNSSVSAGSLRSHSTGQSRTMVGFDDVLYEIMDKLTGGEPDRQIIPIVGMGGIGKTTIAKQIHAHPVIVQHFDICIWVTISQEYKMREILLELLCQDNKEDRGSLSQLNENELGDKLHKRLYGRRYLVFMDDIWNIKVWDFLKLFFPDNKNGSRIMLTTRLSKLASHMSDSHGVELDFLNENDSWNLFCKNVFGKEDCPSTLEDIGKQIVKSCKGLPLSIVVIGGILANSEHTQQHWEHIAENLSSVVNLDDNQRCLHILYTSYNNLPVYLKPCFLYMGVFPEDTEICVSDIIRLWVAEGFLKAIEGKSLEEAAEEYFIELIERNLILAENHNSYGKVKVCKIHDLLRDLCLREAKKQRFLCVMREQNLDIPQDTSTKRRIFVRKSTAHDEYPLQILNAVESASLARSVIWEFQEPLPSLSFRLLRVCSAIEKNYALCNDPCSCEATLEDLFRQASTECYAYVGCRETGSLETAFQQVNLRYLSVKVELKPSFGFPSSLSFLWNLQTLIVDSDADNIIKAPPEIWAMSQLRHVKFLSLGLPDPPMSGQDDIVLENLQTVSDIYDFKFGEEVVKRIPNIKKLKVSYRELGEGSRCWLNNLGRLLKLVSFRCTLYSEPKHLLHDITFPLSLEKIDLFGTNLLWEDMMAKIGSLPLLQVLKLKQKSIIGPEWETVEGQFCSLTFLLIEGVDLECWTTEYTHFPRLKHLHLRHLSLLEEIPSSIGDISTLQLLRLEYCRGSAEDSAKRIQEEQEDLCNVDLKVEVVSPEDYVEEDEDEIWDQFIEKYTAELAT